MTTETRTRRTPSLDLDAAVGERIHMLMWRAGLKQYELAQKLGMSSDSLGRKTRGERGWAIQEIADAAGILGTTISYLVGESGDPDGPNLQHQDYRAADWLAPVTPLHPAA